MDTASSPIAAQPLHAPALALPPPLLDQLRDGVSRSTVRAVADELRRAPADLAPLLEDTLREAGVLPAAWLLLAALIAGRPASREQSLRVLEQLPEEHDDLAAVLAWGCPERRALLLALCESEALMWGQSERYLFLAVEDLGGEAPPPRLLSRLRRWAREMTPPMRLLSLALEAIADPYARRVGVRHLPEARTEKAEREGARLRRLLKAPPLDVAPERAEVRVSGYTVRRQPRAGRNEPCPCGSGQKYKRCCEARDQARAAAPAPVPGLTLPEYRARIAEFVPVEKFAKMTPDELLPIPLDRLPPAHLHEAARRFCTFSRFEQAERALELLLGTPGQEEAAAALRSQLIYAAMSSGRADLLRRHQPLTDDENARDMGQFALWLATDPSPALARLEELAALGLRDPNELGMEGLTVLIDRTHPALALLLARAALNHRDAKTFQRLSEQIDALRDVLGVAPEDRLRDMLAGKVQEARDSLKAMLDDKRLIEQAGQAIGGLIEAKEALAGARRRIAALEGELAEGEALREQARRLVEAALSQEQREQAEEREGEEDRRRLLGKIERLKAVVAEGVEERAGLRQQVADLAARLAERGDGGAEAKAPAPVAVEEDDGPRWESDGYDGWRVVLTPVWAKAADAALHELPPHISREALVTVGQLAAGEPSAWRGAKRLKEVTPPLYEARVGLRYRAMFRVVGETMEVLEIIHRKQLDLRLKKLYT